MSEQPAQNPVQDLLNWINQHHRYISSIGSAVVALALIYYFLSPPALLPVSKGIVYPMSGQHISGPDLTFYSTFVLNELALAQAMTTNDAPTTLESIQSIPLASGAIKYTVHTALKDGDTLSIDGVLYNSKRQSEGNESAV